MISAACFLRRSRAGHWQVRAFFVSVPHSVLRRMYSTHRCMCGLCKPLPPRPFIEHFPCYWLLVHFPFASVCVLNKHLRQYTLNIVRSQRNQEDGYGLSAAHANSESFKTDRFPLTKQTGKHKRIVLTSIFDQIVDFFTVSVGPLLRKQCDNLTSKHTSGNIPHSTIDYPIFVTAQRSNKKINKK